MIQFVTRVSECLLVGFVPGGRSTEHGSLSSSPQTEDPGLPPKQLYLNESREVFLRRPTPKMQPYANQGRRKGSTAHREGNGSTAEVLGDLRRGHLAEACSPNDFRMKKGKCSLLRVPWQMGTLGSFLPNPMGASAWKRFYHRRPCPTAVTWDGSTAARRRPCAKGLAEVLQSRPPRRQSDSRRPPLSHRHRLAGSS